MTRRLELTPGGPTGRRTLAEEAAAELHELILSGELPSGTALRLEELAKRLDMSQMPIREGLRRMQALGLVEIVPHKGAWVRELSMEDLRDTHQTRLALESLAVRAAATRFTEADAATARAALAEHVRLSKAGDNIAGRRTPSSTSPSTGPAGRAGCRARSNRSGRTASATASAPARPRPGSSRPGVSTRRSSTPVSPTTKPARRPRCANTSKARCSASRKRWNVATRRAEHLETVGVPTTRVEDRPEQQGVAASAVRGDQVRNVRRTQAFVVLVECLSPSQLRGTRDLLQGSSASGDMA
jgi:Mn-dependent DtxR family transcriptional regulator